MNEKIKEKVMEDKEFVEETLKAIKINPISHRLVAVRDTQRKAIDKAISLL